MSCGCVQHYADAVPSRRADQGNPDSAAASQRTEDVDRQAWARLLGEWLTDLNPGAGRALSPEKASRDGGGPIPVSFRTIYAWLNEEQGVSARSVRDVARSLGVPPVVALVEVGFLAVRETSVANLTAEADSDVRRISVALGDLSVPVQVRDLLRAHLRFAIDIYNRWRSTPTTSPARRRTTKERTTADA